MQAFDVAVIGAGAFGTALALTQAHNGRKVIMWGRNVKTMEAMEDLRENTARLPGETFPDTLTATADIDRIDADVVLLCVPTQTLRVFLQDNASVFQGRTLVACCKGVESDTGFLPTQIIEDIVPDVQSMVLTGPSFAVDIGQGRPTALTLAASSTQGQAIQELLSTPALRLYFSDDPIGAQLGGALKNVIALGAGMTIGAGLGESARAAVMTRGFSEIVRYAAQRGATPETLWGLSGFGDLILTCSSEKSRNFSYGKGFARGETDTAGRTIEGVMTAHAVTDNAGDLDLPVIRAISAVLRGDITIETVVEELLSRPLRKES